MARLVPSLIVDDQLPFRRAAAAVISAAPGFEVVGEADTGEGALELVASVGPALVLMDIHLPGINGIEATRRIIRDKPAIVVILLSTYAADDLPADARSCGAAAYVHKDELGPAKLQEIWETNTNTSCSDR